MTLKLAEQDYDTGLHYLKRGLLDSALLYFEAVASEFSETEWAPWALYQMVDVFGRIGYQRDVETTRDLLLEAYPDSEPAQMLLEDGRSLVRSAEWTAPHGSASSGAHSILPMSATSR